MRGASYAASERFIGEEQIAEHHEFPAFPSPHPSHQTSPIRQQYVIAAYC